MNQKTILSDPYILDLLQRAYLFAKPDNQAGRDALKLDSTIEELGIESIAALEITGFIEEELGIEFNDNDIASVRGMSDLVRLIKKNENSFMEK